MLPDSRVVSLTRGASWIAVASRPRLSSLSWGGSSESLTALAVSSGSDPVAWASSSIAVIASARRLRASVAVPISSMAGRAWAMSSMAGRAAAISSMAGRAAAISWMPARAAAISWSDGLIAARSASRGAIRARSSMAGWARSSAAAR